MHCVEPACASACLVRALDKTPTGPVVYHKDRCLGCRYCMVACPFDVPKYEYDSALPYVKKCTFCADRQAQGRGAGLHVASARAARSRSAIATSCSRPPASASTRTDSPYVRHIFGEHEVGGTSWMYITDIPFDKLGLPAELGHLRLLVAHAGVARRRALRADPVAAAADGHLHLQQAPQRSRRRTATHAREEADHD